MAFAYLVVDSFSVAFLLILYASTHERSNGSEENRRFCMIVLLTIAALLGDMLAWQLDGVPGSANRLLLWLSNISCYILSGAISLGWFFYVGLKLNASGQLSTTGRILFCLPCCFLTIASLTSPWTGWLFSLDASNTYIRGNLFAMQTIIPFAYLFAAAIRALVKARTERLRQQRRECFYLASFIIFPLIGGLLQILFYGLSLVWPCTALSLMLVYVNLQNQMISLDALTGLNNRGQFDKYLYSKIERADEDAPFALFMLDIDNFKSINDRFGHTAGDAALVSAANILKRCISGSNAFLARYGGDEFAIVLHFTSESQIDDLLQRITCESERQNSQHASFPYEIVFSVGCVSSDKRRFTGYKDMITAADAHMYIQKQQHKAVRE